MINLASIGKKWPIDVNPPGKIFDHLNNATANHAQHFFLTAPNILIIICFPSATISFLSGRSNEMPAAYLATPSRLTSPSAIMAEIRLRVISDRINKCLDYPDNKPGSRLLLMLSPGSQ